MPNSIISEWLNLPGVKFDTALTEKEKGSTEIHLPREPSSGFTFSNCGKRISSTYGSKEEEKLTRLLNLNENLNMTHILRDDLKRLGEYRDIEGAEKFLDS